MRPTAAAAFTNTTLASTLLAAIALLAGCASNPVIPINAAGLSVPVDGTVHPAAASDLASAHQFALQVRAVYRTEMAGQVGTSQQLNSGLLVLGAGIVGLATGVRTATRCWARRCSVAPPTRWARSTWTSGGCKCCPPASRHWIAPLRRCCRWTWALSGKKHWAGPAKTFAPRSRQSDATARWCARSC
ncbi:hypothetical protein ACVBEH_02080 [Roseateles sp. GG27B]